MSALTPTTRHNMSNLDRNPVSTGCLAKVLSEELRVTLKVLKLSRLPPQVRSLSRLLINTDKYAIPPQVVTVTRGGSQNAGISRLLLNPACPSPGPLPIQLVVRSARQMAPAMWLSPRCETGPPGGFSGQSKNPPANCNFSRCKQSQLRTPLEQPKNISYFTKEVTRCE